jgi:16S rRNA (uracil1498-N3)-methyltransferase
VSFARFFAPAAGVTGDRILLPVDEAEHLTRVLRLSSGDRIRVFNGRGAEFEAVVDAADRSGVRLTIGASCPSAPEPRVAVTLVQSVLKGDKMDDVVRDAVMIGVAAIQPIITARSEISASSLTRSRKRERWERIAVSSAKQCGRAVVPTIAEPRQFVLSDPTPGAVFPDPVYILVEPNSSAGTALASLDGTKVPDRATLIVGPEGGWTPEEVESAAAVGTLVTLGKRTLRADAMALVALSAMFTRWGEF